MSFPPLQKNDYVDFLGLEKTWQTARVVEVYKNSVVLHFRALGKYVGDEVQLNSYKIAPFRTKSRGGQYEDIGLTRTEVNEIYDLSERVRSVANPEFLDAKEIINFFRGDLYFFMDFLYSRKPASQAEADATVSLLRDIVHLYEVWLSGICMHISHFPLLRRDPKAAYTEPQLAWSSVWPELFLILKRALDETGAPLFEVKGRQSQYIKKYCDAQTTSFSLYFWGKCLNEAGIVACLNAVSDDQCSEMLAIAVNFPIWEFMFAHIKEIVSERCCENMLLALLRVIIASDQSCCELCEAELLWKVVMICWDFFAQTEEGLQVGRKGLSLCEGMLRSEKLDKRVEGANLLDSLQQKADSNRDFLPLVQEWAPSAIVVLLSNAHTEILQRGKRFLQWSQHHGLLNAASLSALFRSAICAHESYSAAVCEMLLELVDGKTLAGLVETLRGLNSAELDASSLDFLAKLMKKMQNSVPLRDEIIRLIEPLMFEDEEVDPALRAAANEAYASALRSDSASVQSLLDSHLQELAANSVQPHRLRFLSQILQTQANGTNVFSSALSRAGLTQSTFLRASIAQLSTSASYQAEELHGLLKTLEAVGAMKSASLFTEVCELMLTHPSTVVRDALLQFLCESTKRIGDIELLETILKPDRFMNFFCEMTSAQYGLYLNLFKSANRETMNFGDDMFLGLIESAVYGFLSFLAVVCLAKDTAVLQAATTFAIEIFVHTLHPFPPALNFTVSQILSSEALTAGGVRFLLELDRFQLKHQSAGNSEAELEQCVDRFIEVMQFPRGLPQVRVMLRKQLAKIAAQLQAPYFLLRLQEKDMENIPPKILFIVAHYNPQQMSSVVDEHLQELRQALGSSKPVVSRAVWELLVQISTHGRHGSVLSSFSSYYTDCLRQTDFTSSTVFLLELAKLLDSANFRARFSQRKGDVLGLLKRLQTDAPVSAVVARFRHKLVLYCDALLCVLRLLYGTDAEPLPQEDVVLVLFVFEIAAEYFILEEDGNTFNTEIPANVTQLLLSPLQSRSLDLMTAVNHSRLANVAAISLCSASPSFNEGSYRFLTTLAGFNNEFAKLLGTEIPKYAEYALKIGRKARWYFQILQNLCADTSLVTLADGKSLVPHFESALSGADEDTFPMILNLGRLLLSELTDDQLTSLAGTILDNLSTHSRSETYRRISLSLLANLCAHSQSCERTISALSALHRDPKWRRPERKYWRLSADTKAERSYVGITNLGATCYMNSVFQQLCSLPGFLAGVLSCEKQSTRLLPAVQALFRSLRLKAKGVCSAASLLYCLPNAPVDPYEQMDAEEFFNSFMAKMETELQAVGKADLVKNEMMGCIVRTLSGRGDCTHSRTSLQTFMTLSLEVTKKHNLQHSLVAFTQGETLQGNDMLECEECVQRVVTHSQQRVLHLPNTLVISLRRFAYDMDFAHRYKLGDYCEFPETLDARSVAVSGDLPEDYYLYYLKGVVVHFGTAEMGHYYSLVNTAEGQWMKFDDELVAPFNISDLPQEAFGDKSTRKRQSKQRFSPSQCAYLLFYVRRTSYQFRDSAELPLERVHLSPPSPKTAKVLGKLRTTHSATALFPLSDEYYYFVLSVVTNGTTTQTLVFALSYLLTTRIRMKEWWRDMQLFDAILRRFTEEMRSVSYWIVEVLGNSGVLEEILLGSAPVESKKAFTTIVVAALRLMKDPQVQKLIDSLAEKMKTISAPASIDVCHFFELLYQVCVYQSDYAYREQQIAIRVIYLLLRLDCPLPAIAPKPGLYRPESYLGHPLEAYRQPPAPSATLHLGFQLAIIHSDPNVIDHSFLNKLWNKYPLLTLSTPFEREQMAKLLAKTQVKVGELTEAAHDSSEAALRNMTDTIMRAIGFNDQIAEWLSAAVLTVRLI